MTDLSDREIAEAAAEVGISPAELRNALAEQRGGLPARIGDGPTGIVAASTRGAVHEFEETRLLAPPVPALAHLRHHLERTSGCAGHLQGRTQADIVDDGRGLVYRMRAESDGAQGSMVRVDIDASSAKARQSVTSMAIVVTSVFVGLASMLLFGSAVGIGLGVLGVAMAITSVLTLRNKTQKAILHAKNCTQRAIVEASSREIPAADHPR